MKSIPRLYGEKDRKSHTRAYENFAHTNTGASVYHVRKRFLLCVHLYTHRHIARVFGCSAADGYSLALLSLPLSLSLSLRHCPGRIEEKNGGVFGDNLLTAVLL